MAQDDAELVMSAMRLMNQNRHLSASRTPSIPLKDEYQSQRCGMSMATHYAQSRSSQFSAHLLQRPSSASPNRGSRRHVLLNRPASAALSRPLASSDALEKVIRPGEHVRCTPSGQPPHVDILFNALSGVLKETTAAGICVALAREARIHVLHDWATRVYLLLANPNKSGTLELTEAGADFDPTLQDQLLSSYHQRAIRLPIDRGLAAATFAQTTQPSLLIASPLTTHPHFDIEVDGELFGVDAGSSLIGVPLEANGRR